MVHRTHCPSCHHRTTPLALECPVCGLSLSRQPLPRPLLFQAGALRTGAPAREERQTISAPALGRVEPLTILEAEAAEPEGAGLPPSFELEEPLPPPAPEGTPDTFWPVVKMEALEFLSLAILNALVLLLACLTAGVSPAVLYGAFWTYLAAVHGAVSWAYVMVPLVLVGQSPMMGLERLLVDTELPERRMSFSLLHLISATLFPLSFLCMVLTSNHRTLAELLSGQEILQMPSYRAR